MGQKIENPSIVKVSTHSNTPSAALVAAPAPNVEDRARAALYTQHRDHVADAEEGRLQSRYETVAAYIQELEIARRNIKTEWKEVQDARDAVDEQEQGVVEVVLSRCLPVVTTGYRAYLAVRASLEAREEALQAREEAMQASHVSQLLVDMQRRTIESQKRHIQTLSDTIQANRREIQIEKEILQIEKETLQIQKDTLQAIIYILILVAGRLAAMVISQHPLWSLPWI
ncbi:hypothetical protein QBC39DRAFT_386811 [Podospora conica]|nr:hypothetical protein QBC39DRAFT_386811 [Schizothecium conicum]